MKIPAQAGMIASAILVVFALLASGAGAAAQMVVPDPAAPNAMRGKARVCLTQRDTRATIVADKLLEPFAAMRDAAHLVGAEGVAARLCRWNDSLVYEITLLRGDGRVIHVFMDAASGNVVGARNDH